MESSGVHGDENSFQHQNSDRAKATTSTVSNMRRCVSQALLFVEVVGDATNGDLVVAVTAEFVAGSWSFVQPGCFPVTRVRVVLPLPLPVEPLPLWPVFLVETGVGVT